MRPALLVQENRYSANIVDKSKSPLNPSHASDEWFGPLARAPGFTCHRLLTVHAEKVVETATRGISTFPE